MAFSCQELVMIQALLELELSDMARFGYDTLKAEDRRALDVKFAHLQNWWNDDYAREHSRPVPSMDNTYIFQTDDNKFVVGFEVAEKKVIVHSILSKETVRILSGSAKQTDG
jgi:hypothetical protein